MREARTEHPSYALPYEGVISFEGFIYYDIWLTVELIELNAIITEG